MPSEAGRIRQVHRYYKAWQEVQEILHEENASSQAAPYTLTERDHVPASSQDKALTAFAQLGALRLHAKRAMVSLIDDSKEYVLAEATQSLSLVYDSRHGEGDELSMGRVVLPRETSLNADVFDAVHKFRDEGDQETEINVLVISDALNDERFKDKAFVKEKNVRFYVGVPICTKLGVKLGTYSVVSDEPKPLPSLQEIRFLEDVSSAVFDHFVLAKGQLASINGSRLVQGLSSFIQNTGTAGMTSYQGPGQIVGAHEPPASDVPGGDSSGEENDNDGEERIAQSSAGPRKGLTRMPTSSSIETRASRTTRATRGTERLTKQSLGSASTVGPSLPPKSGSIGSWIDSTTVNTDTDTRLIYSDSKAMFTRAADTLRRATLADGCAFFDALSVGARHKETSGPYKTSSRRKQSSERELQSTNEDVQSSNTETFSDSSSPSSSEKDKLSGAKRKAKSELVALSLSESIRSTVDSATDFAMSEKSVTRLLRRYPRGKIFNIDKHGNISSGSDTLGSETALLDQGASNDGTVKAEGVQTRDKTKRPKSAAKVIVEELIKTIPNATSVIFLPLWDFAQERWYAISFLWTTQVGRLMDPRDEMPYIKAFGNSIMSEVVRLDAVHTDRAKTTFIASISHELRSPLHGILGSIEFLHNTEMDSFQRSLVTSIETCGKTLLDTIDHVLDFAKINSFDRNRQRASPGALRRPKPTSRGSLSKMTLTSSLDLSILVEEVVEAIYAGQTFRRQRPGGSALEAYDDWDNVTRSANMPIGERIDQISHKYAGGVSVMLEVDRKTNWTVRTQPGAIRRIVMNIFGNALKYTTKGHVKVTLRPSRTAQRKSYVSMELIFKDTGKGMSEEYLRDRLYKPFAQEDPFSAGTGLGLSIVHQVVDSLGGRISFQSAKDKGTEVTVSLSLPMASTVDDETSNDMVRSVHRETEGLQACIIQVPETQAESAQPNSALHECLAGLLKDSFGMKVTTTQKMDETEADLFLYMEPPPASMLIAQHEARSTDAQRRSRETPLIIVCTNAFEVGELKAAGLHRLTELGRVIEVVSQPCGPLKMAPIIRDCVRNKRGSGREVRKFDSNSPDQTCAPRSLRQQPAPTSTDNPVDEQQAQRVMEMASHASTFTSPISDTTDSNISHEPMTSPVGIAGFSMSENEEAYKDASSSNQVLGDAPKMPYVLLVDDNHINLQLLVTLMKRNSIGYEYAVNGLEALEKYKAQYDAGRPFDSALMDINMPVMDGFECTHKIREFERSKGLTPANIIALTGLASQNAQDTASRTGFDHFMPKPVKFKEVMTLLGVA